MAHMDADDCFYVATATTDVYTDTIFEVDPYTGTAYRALPRRYVLSPFPVFLAVVSQLSGRLHPAVMAHMVFPAVFLSMAYMVQAVLAKNGFPEKKRPRGSIFFWQLVSAVFPAILFTMRETFRWFVSGREKLFWLPYFCRICFVCVYRFPRKKQEISWVPLVLANISCCLLSSMGVILAPLLTGCFFIISLIVRRDWKRVLVGFLCCLPSIALGIVYILMG